MRVARLLVFIALCAVHPQLAYSGIVLWTEKDQQGEVRRIKRAVSDLRRFRLDDKVSSLHADERWLVCSEPAFRGDCREVYGTVANLRLLGMNNRITSLRPIRNEPIVRSVPRPSPAPPRSRPSARQPAHVEPRPGPEAEWWQGPEAGVRFEDVTKPPRSARPQVYVFGRPDYRGQRLRIEEPVADLGQLDLGLEAGSVLVRRGRWEICSRPQFQGECRPIPAEKRGIAEIVLAGSLRPIP